MTVPPNHDRERKRAEIEQTLSGPSDMYPAGVWCEAANWLLCALEQAEAGIELRSDQLKLAQKQYTQAMDEAEALLAQERDRADRYEAALRAVVARCDSSVTGMVHAQTIKDGALAGLRAERQEA